MRLATVVIFLVCCIQTPVFSEVIQVSSQQEFDNAHDSASMNDTISWRSGTYSDIYMEIDNDHLFITSEILGTVIFTGASRVNITGDYITLQGFQFLDGNIGTSDVINITGSNNLITHINIRAYRSYKYLRVRESSQYVDITYCNFENRLNLDDQNILSILVDNNQPGYHKIQYCSFKNFDGTGNDLGIEPIRIGLSTQADRISRTVVEFCYFTQCNGDGELISSKASQNVYRFNTFEDNPKAELVLRHGSQTIVYGNFFLRGKGGVRVREGQNHYIYNNYFHNLDDRTIYLQNNSSDPLDNINIGFNTIVDCAEVILGGDGSNKPTNVTFANNIFADPDDGLFEDATGTETWISNIANGSLGISTPGSGINQVNPQLEENEAGFWSLSETSPAIDAAVTGFASLPQFPGIANIDADIELDLMRQARPSSNNDKDIGCSEYPHTTAIALYATEENTGPHYNTDMATSAYDVDTHIVDDLINISPNPVDNQLRIIIKDSENSTLSIDLLDFTGKKISVLAGNQIMAEGSIVSQDISQLSAGTYIVRAISKLAHSTDLKMQNIKFIKVE